MSAREERLVHVGHSVGLRHDTPRGQNANTAVGSGPVFPRHKNSLVTTLEVARRFATELRLGFYNLSLFTLKVHFQAQPE